MADFPSNGHSATEVKQFFDQWPLYRRVVEGNFLHHREAYAAIKACLEAVGQPFSFVDLGAGDASWTGAALASRRLTSYEAVDLCAVALDLARQNVAALACPKAFIQADFFSYVKERTEPCEVLFIGLSLHHLMAEEKREFFREARRLLPAGGRLLFYEPICEPGESREAVLARWWTVASRWPGLTEEEHAKVKEHVFGYDYPESLEFFRAVAGEAGFSEVVVRYVDDERLYAVVECVA